ncbi:MAG: outer membrane protein assembly factor BamB family protein [Armatimonadota bacterium]
MFRRETACIISLFVLFACRAVFAQTVIKELPDAVAGGNPLPAPEALSPEISAPAVPSASWTMFKKDPAHTGYTDERLAFPLRLSWKFLTDVTEENQSAPAVADGTVYFCSAGRLYAADAATGALKWKYPQGQALSATIRTSPLVGGDLIYFGAGDSHLYAVTRDGQQGWTFAAKGSISSSPVLADGVLYFGSADDHLYALDARTGAPKWPGGFRTKDDVSSSPAVAGGIVYFVGDESTLYAALTTTGQIKWAEPVGTPNRASSPLLADGAVFLASRGALQAFHALSGQQRWSLPVPSEITSVPAVANGVLYFGCKNGNVYAVSTSGKAVWNRPVELGAPVYGSPIVAGDTVILGANKGQVVAIDAKTGGVKWKYIAMPASLVSGKLEYVNIAASPTVAGGLYVLSDDGTLFALTADAPDSTPPQASTLVPARDSVTSGSPPLKLIAVIEDSGSGIDWDHITMLLDGKSVERSLIPERGIVWYKTPTVQPVSPLADGRHTVRLSVADLSGNRTEIAWSFTVDSKMPVTPKTDAPGTGRIPGPPGMPPF